MRTLKSLVVVATLVGLVFAMTPALASQPSFLPHHVSLPDQAGLYDVPGHENLKLRVFVYHGKPDNPGDSGNNGKPLPPPPAETCQATSTADANSTAVVSGAGWILPSRWEYRLNTGSVPSTIGIAAGETIADTSFATWLQEVHVVTVTRGADTTINRSSFDGQNVIAWGRTAGNALATSYIWYNTATGEAVEIDTIMNKKYTWYWSDPATWPGGQTCAFSGVYDAQNILVHELGHSFGLDDEYAAGYANNTMYGYGATGETKKDTLTTGDSNGVSALY